MTILDVHYPNENHVLVFDNVTTHLKREDDALLARKMPKFTPKPGHNWGVEVKELDEDGKPVHDTDGTVLKVCINMVDAKLADGTPQPLYWPEGHKQAGVFKGMAAILEERGFSGARKLKAQCKNFKCKKDEITCFCR
jgi:hypothetical protein